MMRTDLVENSRQDNGDETWQKNCLNYRGSACVGDTNIALLDEGAIDHVDDAISADHIRADNGDLLVVPYY
jgi:hypothetical protein